MKKAQRVQAIHAVANALSVVKGTDNKKAEDKLTSKLVKLVKGF